MRQAEKSSNADIFEVDRIADAYLEMSKRIGYRPNQIRDSPRTVQEEAEDYAITFINEEDSTSFYIGVSNFQTNQAFVFIIEAARLLTTGEDDKRAATLLSMAIAIIQNSERRNDQVKEKDFQLRPPTPLEMRVELLRVQDDASWYPLFHAMQQTYPGDLDMEYEAMCTNIGFAPGGAINGTSPARVHNADTQNYSLPLPPDAVPGIACTYGLVWPDKILTQPQVDAINNCVPLEIVLAAGEAVKATVRAIADKAPAPAPQQ